MATRKKTAKKTAKKSARKAAARKPAARAKAAPKKRAAAPRKGPLAIGDVSPSFTVNDLARSIDFYTNVLGFRISNRWEWEGELRGVELTSGSATFMLGQDDWKKGRDRQKGVGFRVYCTTAQDVDALAQAIKAKGGTLDEEPHTEMWGRFFAFTDPDGFKVTIVNEKIRK